jgi:tetratricopeptide (TPR) repeat protein
MTKDIDLSSLHYEPIIKKIFMPKITRSRKIPLAQQSKPKYKKLRIFFCCSIILAMACLGGELEKSALAQPNSKQSVTSIIQQGFAKLNSGLPEDAKQYAETAISMDAKSADAYFLLGLAEDGTGDKSNAIKSYNKSIEYNPKLAKAYSNRALIKAGQGNIKSALADIDKAISIDPKLSTAYLNRGVAKGAMGDTKGALADFSKAINLNPSYGNAYRNRGITREMIGDLKGACSDWKAAASSGQKETAIWYQKQCLKQ